MRGEDFAIGGGKRVPLQRSYLFRRMVRLSGGMAALPEAVRLRHTHFLRTAQSQDGGFRGRLGGSDAYYTSFGLRALAMLGQLDSAVAESAASMLRTLSVDRLLPADLVSTVFSSSIIELIAGEPVFGAATEAWKQQVIVSLEELRCEDGGYAKGPRGVAGSVYQTFLTLVCFQLLDYGVAQPERVIQFVENQRAELGGFREIRVAKRAGTNPTAAAIGSLQILGALTDETVDETAVFLAGMQGSEGGLVANSRIPVADVLSTFTGLMTLADLNRLDTIDAGSALRFVEQLQNQEGGFRAAAWDTVCDVEYTFYGLGCLALLALDDSVGNVA